MKNCLKIFFFFLIFTSCRNNQQHEQSANAPNELSDVYKKIKLPFYAVDSTMQSQAKDSAISIKMFTSYFPDSIFIIPFGNDRKIVLQPVGKIEQRGKESYFLTFAKSHSLSALYLSVYDSNRHIVTMPIIINQDDSVTNSASIDKKLTIVVNKEWRTKNNPYYNRMIYAYNNVGVFTTVLTETNLERRPEAAIINPLDTFPQRNKYSGDYNKGDKNHLFVRDAAGANEYLFFVHFQSGKSDEKCGGELKGRFKMISENVGQYNVSGDPCNVNFTFKNNTVGVKENGSCGNYRDIKCFFNDVYTKRKTSATSDFKKHKRK